MVDTRAEEPESTPRAGGATDDPKNRGAIVFRTVIVPLNGSESAEAAVPYAVDVADRRGATLVLVRVVARPELSPALPRRGGPPPQAPIWPADEIVAEETRAFTYLDGVARRCRLPAGSEVVVPVGDPFLRLVAEIRRRPAPIVVVAAGGTASVNSASRDLARCILRAGVAPILVVQERAAVVSGVSAESPAAWTHRMTSSTRSSRMASPTAAASAVSALGPRPSDLAD